jgi:antitoxin Phd
MSSWSLQDAKARFSELVNCTLRDGAQLVTRHGEPAVVVIPADEYSRLIGPRQSLAEFFAGAPRVDLNIERSRDAGREIAF